MPCHSRLRRHLPALLLTLLPLAAPQRADAAGFNWNGGSSSGDLWSDTANWAGSSAPVNDGTADVTFNGNSRLTPDMDADWDIFSLSFNSGSFDYTLGSAGDFTLTIQSGGITKSGNGTDTINHAITLGAAQTWSAGSGNLNFGGNIANGGNLLTVTGSSNTVISSVVSGTGGLTADGGGTLSLTGANTYSGATTVNVGTLAANADGALGGTGKVTVNTGGTVMLGVSAAGSDRIGDGTEIALAGGTFDTGGFSEAVGKVTLSADSTFDFGTGSSVLAFDGASDLDTFTLTILNWSGTNGVAGGTDQLLFTDSPFAAGSSTNQILFNIGGTFYGAEFKSVNGNTVEAVATIAPVPEPATIFGAAALLLTLGWRERRRFAPLWRS